MGYPRAVERQAELSEKIRKQAYEAKPPIDGDTPLVETDLDEHHEDPPPDETDYKALYEEEKQRRTTLEGKYNAEVPDLIRSNKELAGQVADFRTDLSALRAEREKQPPPPEPDEAEYQALSTQFQDEPLTKLTKMELRREIKSRDTKIEKLEDRLAKLESRSSSVERRVERTEGQGFEQAMDQLVDKRGNWRVMNKQGSEFLQWAASDLIAGHPRYDLMMASYNKGDFKAVSEHFNEFIKIKNPGKPHEIPADEENLGLPKPGEHGKPPVDKTQEDKKPITRSFVKTTLKDIALGRYRNNPKERQRLSALIDDKQSKNLIVDG